MNPAEHEHDETCDDHNLSLLSTISIWSSLFGMIVIITVTLYYRKIFIYLYTHLISLSLSCSISKEFNKSSTKPEQVAQLISPQALQQVDSFV
jgi:hypothetical protein